MAQFVVIELGDTFKGSSCAFDQLYTWQAKTRSSDKEFLLHDGPPYANGDPHVGHAVNKILKDITTRYKLLQGYRIHYVPGWDCHGLPIEQKALTNIKADHRHLEPLKIRETARKFAEKTIQKQKSAFQRWGVFADWNNCYYTFNKSYVMKQLDVFLQLYEKGFIYQNFMPVFWSPSSRTALAEAELEYNENHQSTSVYVKFPLTNISEILRRDFADEGKVFAVIWTTTPWTLPANKAICYNNDISYSLVEDPRNDNVYLISSKLVENLSKALQTELKTISHLEGGCLSGMEYHHPLTGLDQPLLPASHVTEEKGTGLVHTAPAHGQEDFQVATHHQLNVDCTVDEDGKYTTEAGQELAGLSVLGDGNKKVLDLLAEYVLHQEPFTHSYPYDWRTKQPVIIRASKQWFIDTSMIKDKAQKLLQDVIIYPKTSGQGMISQLQNRTYWCISRQRVWGVPIPVFYDKVTGKPLVSKASIGHIKQLVDKHGTDFWWKLPTEQLLPADVINQSGFSADREFQRGSDVLDIWFDSGSSWGCVLEGKVADVYLEGLDQFGGWFQSSLLTSTAVQNQAPYRSLVVHGFTMDEEGKKMSKSLGNVVDPDVDKQKSPAYGADVLRWWVARAGLDSKVYIGPSILENCNEQLFKMRKALRYLLGNLTDFKPEVLRLDYEDLFEQDRYMLHLLYNLHRQVSNLSSVDSFSYPYWINILTRNSQGHIHKLTMYCNSVDDRGRRSAQTVQWLHLQAILSYIAPIVPHMAEEFHQFLPYDTGVDSYFKTSWFQADPLWHQPDLAVTFDLILNVKDTFNKNIGSELPVSFDVVLCGCPQIFNRLKEPMTSRTSALCEMLQCSSASIISKPPPVIPEESNTVEGSWLYTRTVLPDPSIYHYRDPPDDQASSRKSSIGYEIVNSTRNLGQPSAVVHKLDYNPSNRVTGHVRQWPLHADTSICKCVSVQTDPSGVLPVMALQWSPSVAEATSSNSLCQISPRYAHPEIRTRVRHATARLRRRPRIGGRMFRHVRCRYWLQNNPAGGWGGRHVPGEVRQPLALGRLTSRNKLLDILCYPFAKEPFEYLGPSAMNPDVAAHGTSCIAVTGSHVNTPNDALLLTNHQQFRNIATIALSDLCLYSAIVDPERATYLADEVHLLAFVFLDAPTGYSRLTT
ncbi:hypothetical protein LSH36_118g05020 [Paralvinella palmiformis]|uniref:isoleucine--tRNA ligase n=1 Tax=Paralvinella palmiformis TaxID=53620 RepID=A0AAD9JY53_9ANNE|nr:hypothetical protein LSH36_118g05020 [Paralvinella palmiformis]